MWKKCHRYSPQPAALKSWNLAVVRSIGSIDVPSSSKAGHTGWAANPPVGRAGKRLQLEDEGTGCWGESPVLAGKVNSVDRGDLKPVAVAGLLQRDDTWKKERCIKNILACSFCYLCFVVFGVVLFVMFIQWKLLFVCKESYWHDWASILSLESNLSAVCTHSTTCHTTPEPPLSNRKINLMTHWTSCDSKYSCGIHQFILFLCWISIMVILVNQPYYVLTSLSACSQKACCVFFSYKINFECVRDSNLSPITNNLAHYLVS